MNIKDIISNMVKTTFEDNDDCVGGCTFEYLEVNDRGNLELHFNIDWCIKESYISFQKYVIEFDNKTWEIIFDDFVGEKEDF